MVDYQEIITKKVYFNSLYKKQSGCPGQYAHIIGWFEPIATEDFVFDVQFPTGQHPIPNECLFGSKEGFLRMMNQGRLGGFRVNHIKFVITDGRYHAVDSSPRSFQHAAIRAFRTMYSDAEPIIIEPIMYAQIKYPIKDLKALSDDLLQRRGKVLTVVENKKDLTVIVDVHIPLSEIFPITNFLNPYENEQLEYHLKFHDYDFVPVSISNFTD